MKHLLIFSTLICIMYSCKKEIINNDVDASLNFSNDTVIFDTTFYSVGSSTKTLIVYNNNEFPIITNISLNTINEGSFRINVDGSPGNNHNNVEIPSNDSIFIFLEVTPNQNTNNVFLLLSSIEFTTGNTKQFVNLVAPGRNAHFHLPENNLFTNDNGDSIIYRYHSISEDETWTNDLPHVIYGQIVIEPEATLTIEEGTKLHFHNNSGIFVGNPILLNNGIPPINNGTLIVNGALGNEVIMKGDRLEEWYEESPGQWNGIHFVPGSINNIINYAIITNGNTAIRVDSAINNNPTLTINNTIIKNMSSIGILGQGANITGSNILINKCGQYTLACYIGGNYNFTHCTFANYWNYNNRNNPSILLNNYYEDINSNIQIRDLQEATFINCIIYGPLSTEISFQENTSGLFQYKFENCLIKLDENINTNNNTNYSNVIINQSPEFINGYENNLHLDSISPAINSGKETLIDYDIENNFRDIPDIGVFEFQN